MQPPKGSLLAVLVLVVLLVVVIPVSAHGNVLSADTQLSANGSLRMESLTTVTESFVVLHSDDNGSPGEVIGHRSVPEGFFHPGFRVSIEPDRWENLSRNASVWAVLHHDEDGDGEFNASEDPPLTVSTTGDLVGSRIAVGKNARAAYVLAAREPSQQTNVSKAVVREVRLPSEGFVVLRTDENGSPGRVVGQRQLAEGRHRNVTVDIDEQFYLRQEAEFDLWAVVHRSDGDGVFNAARDGAITVAGSPVGSAFEIERTDDRTPIASETGTPATTETEGGADTSTSVPETTAQNGEESHEHDGDTGEHHHDETTETPTRSHTASPSPTAAATPTASTRTAGTTAAGTATEPPSDSTDATTDTPAVGTPGMGALVTVVALSIVLLGRQTLK